MESTLTESIIYFLNNGYWKIAEIVLKNNIELKDEYKQRIEDWLWQATSKPNKIISLDKECFLLAEEWQRSWISTRLLCYLQTSQENFSNQVEPAMFLKRQESLFQSNTKNMELKDQNLKDLSHLYDQILHADLINQAVPNLKKETYLALCNNLIDYPGMTIELLKLLHCDHLAFTNVQLQIANVYKDSVDMVLYKLNSDGDKLADLNSLLSIIILTPDLCDESIRKICIKLQSVSCASKMPLAEVLKIVSCCKSPNIYKALISLYDKQMLRHTKTIKCQDNCLVQNIYNNIVVENGNIAISELFARVVKGQTHWVEDIVGVCGELVLNGEFQKLHTCMENPMYHDLWPLIVIYVWNNSDGQLELLDVICPLLDKCKQRYPNLFSKLCDILKKVKMIFDWLQSNSKAKLPDLNAMLSLAKHHSLLYIIKATSDITKLDYIKLQNFISKIYAEDHNPNAKQDIQTFNGYVVLFSAFNIILQAIKIDKQLQNITKEEDKIYEEIGISYSENVKKKLQSLVYNIEELQPLEFRLEILENLFSLLFLRYEDMVEESFSDTSHDEEDNYSQLSKSSTQPVPSSQHSAKSLTSSSFPPTQVVCNNVRRKISTHSTHRRLSSKGIKIEEVPQGFLCSAWLLEDLVSTISTSLPQDDLLNQENLRISRLKKSLNDAQWRIKLLKDAGVCSRQTNRNREKHEDLWVYQCGESSESDEEVSVTSSSSKTMFKKLRQSIGSEKASQSSYAYPGKRSANMGLKRKHSKYNKGNRFSAFKSSCGVIDLMLSSPSSLICFFLAKGDIVSSENVIQRFEMQDSPVDKEIAFQKSFNQLKENLKNIKLTPTMHQKESTLQTINEVASAGVFATSINSLLENFFSSTQIPSDSEGLEGCIVLDLALTLNISQEHSKHFLNLASGYLSSATNKYSGVFEDLQKRLKQLLFAVDDDLTIPDLLRDAIIPFHDVQAVKDINTFWEVLNKNILSFNTSLNSDDLQTSYSTFLMLAVCALNSKGVMKVQLQDTPNEPHNFLSQLLIYITQLSQLASLDSATRETSDEDTSSLFEKSSQSGVHFSFLKMDLKELIGHLVFHCNIDPVDLERTTKPLGIDLVHYLIQNCTPVFPVAFQKNSSSVIVLNDSCKIENSVHIPSNENPYFLMINLLQELLDALEGKNIFQITDRQQLTNNPAVQKVFEKSSSLINVNLKLLTSEDHILTFLINLSNLVWLHGLILLESGDESFGLISPSFTLREVALSTVGYCIGEIGFVSLLQLWATLLPASLFTDKHVVTVFPIDIQVSTDPRVLFALGQPYQSTAKVQVFTTDLLDSQLEHCMLEYIQKHTIITDSTLFLPELVHRYIDFLMITQSPEGDDSSDSISNYSSERSNACTEFLKDNLLIPFNIAGKNIEVIKDILFTIDSNSSGHSNTSSDTVEHNKSWKDYALNQSVMQFLAQRSPILGNLVEKLYSIEEAEETGVIKSTSAFESYLNSKVVSKLSEMYEGSQILAALHRFVPEHNLWSWFDVNVENKDWLSILEMINFLPEYQFKNDFRLINFKDDVLTQLACQSDGWTYCQCIENGLKMAKCALTNLEYWPGDGCEEVLRTLLNTPSCLSDEILVKVEEMLTVISLCQKIVKVSNIGSWKLVYETDPWNILELLLDSNNINIALEWANYNEIPRGEQTSACLFLIRCFVLGLFEIGLETAAVSILSYIEVDQAVQICEHIVTSATSLSSLQHAVSFLIHTEGLTVSQRHRYKLLDIGVHMLAILPWQDQEWYRKLISQPELFIEQLLMNTKISTLETVLHSLGDRISELNPGSSISPQCLDALLRRYASKALEISVRTKSLPSKKSWPSVQIFDKDKFAPPENPPKKQDWIPNDDVTECMCCHVTVFSMFNRRHHCRRCGRVVCASCSSHRIKVAGYANVTVRVCNDCLEYTTPKTLQIGSIHNCSSYEGKITSVEKDSNEPEWLLSWDLVYNSTVRDEFTYAHAPSVSLCMSILKLHFEPTALLRFLVTTIEDLVQLLRPTNPGVLNPEVDYIFLVRMIRTLVEFSRVCSSRQGIPSYGAQIEHIIAEVNLLDLLVSSHAGCALLPCEPLPCDPLRGLIMLRQLRENLLEQELFTLALEVSTKFGLDYGSVWSAWGKACLKAGAWNEAREKFSHCNLQKKEMLNVAILNDILQLLQSNQHSADLKTRLSHLQNVATGKSMYHQSSSRLDPCVLEECLYYLKTYGNHGQMLKFHVEQYNLKAAMNFVLESSVEPQVFLDSFFLPCLRLGLMMQAYEQMATTDKTLRIWKAYLRVICAYFEYHKMYNVLYQTQIWMNDHIRAAMTCIYFFTNGARSYSDLGTNIKYLESAAVHLQTAQKCVQDERKELVMHLNTEEIGRHLSTVKLQLEVTRFLTENYLDNNASSSSPPTLFHSNEQRSRVAIMVLISGEYLEQSLILANRIIEEWNLDKSPIFCQAGTKFVENGRSADVQKLVEILKKEEKLCNDIIMSALRKNPIQPDSLITLISDIPTKITAYIECGQLKSAYLLAIKWERIDDITRILHAAERLNQPLIHKICLKRLGQLEE